VHPFDADENVMLGAVDAGATSEPAREGPAVALVAAASQKLERTHTNRTERRLTDSETQFG
jgi:hypothetical protein